MATTRVNFTIPEDLLEQMDKEASALHLNRSAYITVAISQKIQADEAMRNLPALIAKLNEQSRSN